MKWIKIISGVISVLVRSILAKRVGQSKPLPNGPEQKGNEQSKTTSAPIAEEERPLNLEIEKPRFPVKYIVIHHSEMEDTENEEWEIIREYHIKNNRWIDIGYHFGTEKVDGAYKIMKGRPMDKIGAHAKDGGFNNKSLGICMVGNFDKAAPPHTQIFLTQSLVREFQRMFHVPKENVIGHREAQKIAGLSIKKRKSCPGHMTDMNKFRENLLDQEDL